MWCDVMWRGLVWCGVMWCDVVWCYVVWCDLIRFDAVYCADVLWRGVAWCDEIMWCYVTWCGVIWLIWFDLMGCSVMWCGMASRGNVMKWCGVVWRNVMCGMVVWFCMLYMPCYHMTWRDGMECDVISYYIIPYHIEFLLFTYAVKHSCVLYTSLFCWHIAWSWPTFPSQF